MQRYIYTFCNNTKNPELERALTAGSVVVDEIESDNGGVPCVGQENVFTDGEQEVTRHPA